MKREIKFEFEIEKSKVFVYLGALFFIASFGFVLATGWSAGYESHDTLYTNTIRGHSGSEVSVPSGENLKVSAGYYLYTDRIVGDLAIGTGGNDLSVGYDLIANNNVLGDDTGSNPGGDAENQDSGWVDCQTNSYVVQMHLNDVDWDEYDFVIDCHYI